MRKLILSLLMIAVISIGAVMITACSSESPVPGVAWAEKETLTYEIKEGDTLIGTLTVVSERLKGGEYKIERLREEPFKLSSGSARVTKVATDTQGKEIMYSESLLNGFTSLASYKKVDYNGVSYENKVYHEGRYFYYSKNGGDYKRIKANGGYADNELLYNIIRLYDIDGGYSSEYKVLSPNTDSLEKIAVSVSDDATNFALRYTDRNGGQQEQTVACLKAVFRKTESPSGQPISVWYAKSSFILKGSRVSPRNESLYIPVKIVENNLTYSLINAKAE